MAGEYANLICVAKTKAERLLNLVIALLNSQRYRDVGWIREKVDGYSEASSDEAFFRMFERDKNELRDLGIPLQTSAEGSYRIPPGEFSIPELTFTPSEKAALALASRLWQTTALAEAGSGALRKINDASGMESTATSNGLLQPRVRTADPAFQPLFAAVKAKRVVTFEYRKEQADEIESRRLQPWGLVSWRGRWYVVGFDEDRNAQRTFRLSRIVGQVKTSGRVGAFSPPQDIDLLAVVAASTRPPAPRTAVLLVRPGRADGLRRNAIAVGQVDVSRMVDADQLGAGATFDQLRIPMGHLWDTARAIASQGPDVIVESPDDLRSAVVRTLQGFAPPVTEPGDSNE